MMYSTSSMSRIHVVAELTISLKRKKKKEKV